MWLQAGLTVAAVYWLVRTLSWAELTGALRRLPALVLIAGTLVYGLGTLGRVARFRMLGAAKVRFVDLVAITWLHNLYNNILPFRLGEVSYLILAQRIGAIGAGTSATAVVVSRICDVMGLAAVLLISVIVAGSPFGTAASSAVLVIGLAVVVAAGAALILVGGRILGALAARTDSASPWGLRLREAAQLLRDTGGLRLLGPLLAWSVFMVALSNLVNAWTLQAVGIGLTYWQLNLAMSASFLVAVLPIQPVGGWGLFESAVVLGLKLYGYDSQTAMLAGVALHLANYVYFVPFGVAGWLLLWRRK